MRLREAVLKASLGRLRLYHLRSPYHVELNEAAVAAIEASLAEPEHAGPGRALVERLAAHGLVESAPFAPSARRSGTDLTSLEIEPVGRCNLACRHCFVSFSRQRMSEAVYDAVLEGARAMGAVELTFNGGEPLLHRRTLDWIDRARSQGLRVVLFTNGTLATKRVASRLAAAGVAKVVVSIDGFEEEHDALRGSGAFRRAVLGIRRLVAEGLVVCTTTMVHAGNFGDRDALRRFLREELGVRTVRESTVAPFGRAAGDASLALAEEGFRAVYAEAAPPARTGRSGLLPCAAAVDKLFISAAGGVYGCHLFEQAGDALGQLPERPLDELHASLRTGAQGDRYLRHSEHQLVACAACPALARCRGGCRARAWLMTRDPFGPDPISCRRMGLSEPSHAATAASPGGR
jgi:AdoMet-dependent heme synthase